MKLTAAIHKIQEEDPSLHFRQNAELQEMSLAGQGEIHLKVAAEKLASKYGLKITTHQPKVPYKETIRKPGRQHGRHKRQSGGHGQFGDVHIEIKPLPRGTGFVFEDQIKGGVVPRQFIPSVEKGVIDYLKQGPLGFSGGRCRRGAGRWFVSRRGFVRRRVPDGCAHRHDGRHAQLRARSARADHAREDPCAQRRDAKANQVVSGRRGQLMGYDARPGWKGWDTVEAQMPLSELHSLIIDLRSLTQGVGTFEMEFDHLAELTGKLADHVVASHKAAA